MLNNLPLPFPRTYLPGIYAFVLFIAICFYYSEYQEVLSLRQQLYKLQEKKKECEYASHRFESYWYKCENTCARLIEEYNNQNLEPLNNSSAPESEFPSTPTTNYSPPPPLKGSPFKYPINIQNENPPEEKPSSIFPPPKLPPPLKHNKDNTTSIGFVGWPIPPQITEHIPLNLEFFPNLIGPYIPPPFYKSLLVCTTGESGKKLLNKLVEKFGLEHFSYVIFLYDKSNWQEFSWYDKVIWIRASRQVKFWYIQRFITPELVRQYEFLWIIDDDVGVEQIDPLDYERIMRKYDLQYSQPANLQGPDLKVSHAITIQVPGNHIGRYTKFVEIGPLIVFTAEAWNCAYTLLQADVSCGWGYDGLWFDYCKFKNAAIIDRYPLTHQFKGNLMAIPGRPDPAVEKDVLVWRFDHVKTNFPTDMWWDPEIGKKFG
eukprot:TRINITY_DN384_c1_g2_i1.p1 TRINITY_DN384_c1_g2~~TRINITY_DN384_c1_g2_i1.p1  ORF type:complete len:430 (-),score=58.77 TRINITY_DN384_c1_g2_i1:47-1336(-)